MENKKAVDISKFKNNKTFFCTKDVDGTQEFDEFIKVLEDYIVLKKTIEKGLTEKRVYYNKNGDPHSGYSKGEKFVIKGSS